MCENRRFFFLTLTKFWLLPRENINFDLEEIIERLPDLSNYSQKHIDKILLQASTEVGFSAGKPTLHTQKPPPHEVPFQSNTLSGLSVPQLHLYNLNLQHLLPTSFLPSTGDAADKLRKLYQRWGSHLLTWFRHLTNDCLIHTAMISVDCPHS